METLLVHAAEVLRCSCQFVSHVFLSIYSFDFCVIDESESPVENLGQVVFGERIRPSPYNVSASHCQHNQCAGHLRMSCSVWCWVVSHALTLNLVRR